MQPQLIVSKKYTLIYISAAAITFRKEITIARFDESTGRHVAKEKGKRTPYYLPAADKLQDYLVFEGHNLPLVIDSDTDRFTGNAQFNFVTDNPAGLKAFIEMKCLNPSPDKFARILYTGTDRSGSSDLAETPLFPEAGI